MPRPERPNGSSVLTRDCFWSRNEVTLLRTLPRKEPCRRITDVLRETDARFAAIAFLFFFASSLAACTKALNVSAKLSLRSTKSSPARKEGGANDVTPEEQLQSRRVPSIRSVSQKMLRVPHIGAAPIVQSVCTAQCAEQLAARCSVCASRLSR
eukprot:2164063-Prymnesium_polylepis.2